MADRIDLQIRDAHNRIGRDHLVALEQRPHAGQQLGKLERLDQIVVGAEFKASHLVVEAVASRQHEHRYLPGGTQRGQDGEAVDAWQHDVQDDQVVIPVGGGVQAVRAVPRDLDHETALAQALAQVLSRFRLVFDDQDFQTEVLRWRRSGASL